MGTSARKRPPDTAEEVLTGARREPWRRVGRILPVNAPAETGRPEARDSPLVEESHPGTLTPRELHVLELIATGMSTVEVAQCLYVSSKDVEYHIGHLLSKFQSKNRTGVVSKAYVLGYLLPEKWPPVARREVAP